MIFTDNTIEKRVMVAVKRKIKSAQTQYESEVKRLDIEYKEAVDLAERQCISQKSDVAEKLVTSIIGKFISDN
ncbi:MAG: hypothetical protein V4509_00645 [Patescibacteria group bacterium]